IEPLFDLEVLVKGEVVVPPAWADDIVPGVRVVKSTEGSVVARSILQRHGKLPVKGSRAVRAGRPHGRRNKITFDVGRGRNVEIAGEPLSVEVAAARNVQRGDRKSTRLNSSHVSISYAVFCLKKKIARRT